MADHKQTAGNTATMALDGEAMRLHELFNAEWDYVMAENPEFATYAGHPGHDHRWTDSSPEAIQRRKEHDRQVLAQLQTIDRGALTEADQLNYDIFLQRMTRTIESHRFPDELLPVTQFMGAHQDIDRMIGMMSAFTTRNYEDMVGRLQGVPALIDQVIVLLEQGIARGVTPPRITLRDVPRQITSQIHEDPFASPMLRAFLRFPEGIAPVTQERLRKEGEAAYRDGVVPAFRKLEQFVTATYLPGCRETIAIADVPDGAAWYDYLVRYFTTTTMKPQEIHDLGLSEVKRIRGEMDRVIARAGHEGTFEEFTEYLRTAKRFYFDSPADLIAAYRDIAKRIDPELMKLFGRLPRLPYGVVAVPEHAEQAAPTAYYEGGSLEAGRPGLFYANTFNLQARPSWEMEALTLHEGVPGHHLQIALASELTDVPEFRKHIDFTAYIEGWGLYSEYLGEELGLYTDPYSKFGQLAYEMWRACRLVVDTGMHALGWSRDKAIAFMLEQTGKTEHDVVVEVDRYIVWPGQALAYKIGELTLKRLRAESLAALGDKFDVRHFHDEVLAHGALPLDMLETRIKAWVKGRQEQPAGA